MRNRKLQMLCEGAILVALAQILSMLKLWEMPWGGSITLGMLPIFLFAVRWGTRWGLVAGFAYGLLQVMFDGGFAISWQSILGDYLVAFTVLGLAGLGRGREKGIFLGTVLGGAARFVVHWVVGATVWAMYMPDAFFGMTMTSPWLYSLLYSGLPAQMRRLCARARTITPNLTEAAFLLDRPYPGEHYDRTLIGDYCRGLLDLSAENVIITDVSFSPEETGIAILSRSSQQNEPEFLFRSKFDGVFHGTGDVFASFALAGLLQDMPLKPAAERALDLTHESIEWTLREGQPLRYGVQFERVLKKL